jgi:hypothetical protein
MTMNIDTSENAQPVGTVIVSPEGKVLKVLTQDGSYVDVPLNSKFYTIASSAYNKMPKIEKFSCGPSSNDGIKIKSCEDFLRKVSEEMACLNPMLFTEDFIYNSLLEIDKLLSNAYSKYVAYSREAQYGKITNSMIRILELDAIEDFSGMLKMSVGKIKGKMNVDSLSNYEDWIDEVIEYVESWSNKFKYDKIVARTVIKEMQEKTKVEA